MALQQGSDVEFVFGVKSTIAFGDFLAEQPVSADDAGLSADRRYRRMVDDDQVIANLVERILVASRQQRGRVRNRLPVLEEDLVAQLLRPLHLALRGRKIDFQRSYPPQRVRSLQATA